MEVNLTVPEGTDVSAIIAEYPDLSEDEGYGEGWQSYWIGHAMAEGESEGFVWLTYDECVEFCGFCEGAITEASTLLEGNGGWAQGMLSRRDFAGFAVSDKQKQEWKERSDLWWAAHARGEKTRASTCRERGD